MGDGIDGNIARYKNLKSEKGDLLDTLGGYLAIVLIILGMGNAAYYEKTILFGSKIFPIVIAELSAAFTLFQDY